MRTPAQILSILVAGFLAVGAATGDAARPDKRKDFRAAIQQARDGDLQADWNKMLDARERFAAAVADDELGALAQYYMGYTDWRLASVAFMAIGPSAQAPLLERAIGSLEIAIQKRPAFPDAQALFASCATLFAFGVPANASNASVAEALLPRITAAWQAALATGANNPRVVLLHAINTTFAPPPRGDREKGWQEWRQAIELFKKDRPEPLMPDWGYAEAVAWLGGSHLSANKPADAAVLLERAVKLRPDFWWAGKVALPVARRPIDGK